MDDIFLKQTAREIHPTGTFAAVCVDLIDLGMRVRDFQGHKSAAQSVAFVFRTGKQSKEGYPLDLSQEFSVSLHAKANMRKFLEQWRGKPMTQEECGTGFSLVEFASRPALISVIHNPSADGMRVYANIGAIMPVPDGMVIPSVAGYQRAPYWKDRKEQYAAHFEAFMLAGDSDSTGQDPVPF